MVKMHRVLPKLPSSWVNSCSGNAAHVIQRRWLIMSLLRRFYYLICSMTLQSLEACKICSASAGRKGWYLTLLRCSPYFKCFHCNHKYTLSVQHLSNIHSSALHDNDVLHNTKRESRSKTDTQM